MSSLTLTAKPERAKLAFGKKHKAHVLITLEGRKDQAARKPFSLTAVIDISGSMSGTPVLYAKKTLVKLIENMTAADTLGGVAYATGVETIFEPMKMTPENKAAAKAAVLALQTRDCTNLSGGMLEGFGMLKNVEGGLRRVFLMTDGLPNVGVSDLPGLVGLVGKRPEGTGLSTFGYGTDYNVELLQAMARAGGGQAYHVESPDQIPAHFGRELGGLLSLVAQAVKVKITAKEDVKILRVLNDLDVKGNKDQTEAEISVDDVYSEEKRHILLEVELPEMEKSGRPFKFADVRVEFQDLLAKEPRLEETALKVEYVPEKEADRDADKEVQEQVVQLEAAQAQEEARKLADAGQFSRAQAVVRQASLAAKSLGTVKGLAMAADLEGQVMCRLSPAAYAAGGAHYLRSNTRSYTHGRAQNAGSAALFDTGEQKLMADEFQKDGEPDPAVPAMPPFPFVGGVPQSPMVHVPQSPAVHVPQSPAVHGAPQGRHIPAPKRPEGLSKKRTRRS